MRFSQHVPRDAAPMLAQVLRLTRGQSIFPNLLSIQLKCWPLTPSESYILFAPKLRTIDLSKQFDCIDETHSSNQRWGPLSRARQQQWCIQLVLRRCPVLQTCRCRISLGTRDIRYLSPEAKQNVGSVRSMHYITPCPIYCGVVELPPEHLAQISRTEDLFDLHLNVSKSNPIASKPRRRQRSLPHLVQSLSTFSFEQQPATLAPYRPSVRYSSSAH